MSSTAQILSRETFIAPSDPVEATDGEIVKLPRRTAAQLVALIMQSTGLTAAEAGDWILMAATEIARSEAEEEVRA